MNTFELYLVEQLDNIKLAMSLVTVTATVTTLALLVAAVVLRIKKHLEEDYVETTAKVFQWTFLISLALAFVNCFLPTSQSMARIAIVPKVMSELYLTEDKAVDDFVQNYITKEAYKEDK